MLSVHILTHVATDAADMFVGEVERMEGDGAAGLDMRHFQRACRTRERCARLVAVAVLQGLFVRLAGDGVAAEAFEGVRFTYRACEKC